ncbi:MAG: tetratricopeptide repeat protein [Acidobacteria bacterium]|nr:tetratricopeptide repeat protein [Acidobacteriota bacterium]
MNICKCLFRRSTTGKNTSKSILTLNGPMKRQRLDALRQSQKQHSKNKEQQLQNFYLAYHADDKEAVWEVISRNRELITESIIWQQLLNEYFENLANNRADRADETLRALFYAGVVEQEKDGDSFVKELAIYYSGLPPLMRNKLAQAHNLLSEGNRHFINTDFVSASSKYTSAISGFQSLGNKWEAFISRYLQAYCEILKANNSVPIALEQLLMESKANGYLWFQAQVYNALGTCYTNITRTSEGIKNTTLSLDISEQINDHLGVQRNECELARQHLTVGATFASLNHLGRCMQSADRNWPGYRQMLRYYNTAGRVFLGMNNRYAAEAFSGAAFRLSKDEMQDRASIISTSLNLGDTYRKSGRNDEASRMYEISYKTAQAEPRIEVFRIREASAAAMLGNIYYDMKNYDRSVQYYTESIELHDELDSVVNRYDALKGRFLAHVAGGNDTQAHADLEEIRKSSESYRKYIREEGHRNTFFSMDQEFSDAAIDFLYSRKEVEKAFELSEATRARSLLDLIRSQARITSAGNSPEFILESVTEPVGIDYIQAKLPEKALILQYAVLKEKIIIWVISKNGINGTFH